MTNPPSDLLAFRRAVQAETGLKDPTDVGIVGDGAHQGTGGYHEGRSVLIAIGRFHASASAGSSTEDYSARLARDRAGLTEDASAGDIASEWPRGGRAAWIRFNRLLVAALQSGDPALSAVRAINYSPDGTSRHRIDREPGFDQIDDTTDSVTIHTHLEWYRDTAGRRQASLDRIVQLIRAAISKTAPGDDDMTPEEHNRLVNIDAQVNALVANTTPAVLTSGNQANNVKGILAGIAVDAHAAANRPITVNMTPEDLAAIIAGLASLVPSLQQIEDAAFRGSNRAEDS
jgi:hypothetical protein